MNKLGLLFPGHGTQYIGMGRKWYEEFSFIRHTFQEANDTLDCKLDELCFSGRVTELNKPSIIQPALFIISYCAFQVYMHEVGMKPVASAGHSLGEYASLVASQALSFKEALSLVQYRGELTERLIDNQNETMIIVNNIRYEVVQQICGDIDPAGEKLSISCINSPHQFAVSGLTGMMDEAEEHLIKAGANVTPLYGSAPFHSLLMNQVSLQLHERLKRITFRNPEWLVISNVTGQPYENVDTIGDLLATQLISPVQWIQVMSYMQNIGITNFIELGPKNILSQLARDNIDKKIKAYSYDIMKERESLITQMNMQTF